MRAKTGIVRRQKHKKIFSLAKGYRMARHKLFRSAHEATLHAGEYAFAGRKRRKRELRKIWTIRLNAAARKYGLSYSRLIASLKKNKVELDRKILAHLAVKQPTVFEEIIKKIKA